MVEKGYNYVIVGGGLAGASAVEGIRERDKEGSILLVGSERQLPYHRPPLSKKLWFGKKKVGEIFVYEEEFYARNGVDLELGALVTSVDIDRKTILDDTGRQVHFDKLLLATGGVPRRLDIPGGDLDGISYYRYLEDYLVMRSEVSEGKSAVVVGGGFIGSEMAAALSFNKIAVTMVYPEPYIVARIFPQSLGRAIQQHYIDRGITILHDDLPIAFQKRADKFVTQTKGGAEVESDILVVGAGILPDINLAERAGLDVANGVMVNDRLQTSHPDIYAAGDNANFPYAVLGQRMRIEHWDNALNQGRLAGANMAGADEPYTYMPYFYSDLFEFGYEAVGDIDPRLETFAAWKKENDTGVIYYLKEGRVRGVMLCNVWEKLDAARELIRKGERMSKEDLVGAIRRLAPSERQFVVVKPRCQV
ncbi:MAG: FAD-dependent oxidoreductase, partial [Armatimonadetes bacterium]|nr:FAD-dependent oxidoreductase [Armatimonadota bacterium]